MMKTTTFNGFFWASIIVAAGMNFIIGMDTVIKLYNIEPTQVFTVWAALAIIFSGLGGSIEIVGGLWTLLIKWGGFVFKSVSQSS